MGQLTPHENERTDMKRYVDLQSYYDDAVAFFSVMPRQSIAKDENGVSLLGGAGTICTYYDEFLQDRCIIGQFIPLGHPAEKHIGGVQDLAHHYRDLAGIVYPIHHDGLALADVLQGVHDHDDNWDETGFIGWAELMAVADRFDLTFTPPESTITWQSSMQST